MRSGRHDVVALYKEIAKKRAEKQDPDKGRESRSRCKPDGSGLWFRTGAPPLKEPSPCADETRKHDEHKDSQARPKRDNYPCLVFVPGHALKLHSGEVDSETYNLVMGVADCEDTLLVFICLP